MPDILPISTILQVADICQYLAANDTSKNNSLKSGNLAPSLPLQIFNAKTVVRWMYNLNPSDSSLRQTANYLFQLLGSYAITAQRILSSVSANPPVITGPTSQTVPVGSSATFSVSVTGNSPFTYEWYDHFGNLIVGATTGTYIFPNAQLTDNDKYFYVKVTDAVGRQAVSGLAFLTVTAVEVGYFYQGNTDYSTNLLANNDNVAYLGTFPITTGQPFTITFPHLGANEFIVVKYPDTEPTKTNYQNPVGGVDSGPIPGLALGITSITVWKYIFTHNGNTFGVNNVNGQVKFS